MPNKHGNNPIHIEELGKGIYVCDLGKVPNQRRLWGAGRWWGTGRPGVLQSMGSQRVGHN